MSTVISLCDLSEIFVQPWVDAGFDAILVDPQHGFESFDHKDRASIQKLPMTVQEAMPIIGDLIRNEDIAFVAGFPPCTQLSGSGAKHWAKKRGEDYMFQARAVAVAEQCRVVGQLSGAPWLVENPVGALSRVFGRPDHTFHPHDYTALEPGDNYTKRTCLWVGGGFRMPPPQRDPSLGPPDDRIHKAPPSSARANFRSATPMGFARAVYAANARTGATP